MNWESIKREAQASLRDFAGLLYPELCCGCGCRLDEQEEQICLHCLHDLPRTKYHLDAKNPIEQMFWGEEKVKAATAWLTFRKASPVQGIMHQLKYGGREDLGLQLGERFAADLIGDAQWDYDALVPVPLHPQRQAARGYNQAEVLARGMAKLTGLPVLENALFRRTANATQTKRSRWERWANVESIFGCQAATALEGKRILLVDDVITTGSTLSSCARELLAVPGTTVLIAAAAYAQQF